MFFCKNFYSIFVVFAFVSCNYVTYTPRSKKNIRRETPSIVLFDRIVDFRIEQMGWPVSKTDFISKGIKYYEVFEDFPYQETRFHIIDSNHMTFYFYNHKKDIEKAKRTNKVDLNSYNGSVRFYKENGKFIWKLKMN